MISTIELVYSKKKRQWCILEAGPDGEVFAGTLVGPKESVSNFECG